MEQDRSQLNFLDCEASSLWVHLSYPTEIGWVASDLSAGYVALVRPEPDWDDWCKNAETITDLSHESIIRLGESVASVAGALNDMLIGAEVATDSPGTDGRWLRRLYAAAGMNAVIPVFDASHEWPDVPARPLLDSDSLVIIAADQVRRAGLVLGDYELIQQQVIAMANLKAHRALDDALMQAILLRSVRMVSELQGEDLRDEILAYAARISAVKGKIIGGAVARHERAGGKDGAALRQILER